jgi:cobalt-zinc-cadmium efflux system outer membrane protein
MALAIGMPLILLKEGDVMGLDLSKLAKAFLFFFLLLVPFSSLAQSETPRLNVDQLVEEALQNNPEILAAKKKWEAYKERIPQASALEDPMFSFGIINLPTSFSFHQEDMTMKEFSISQKFPFPGKRPLHT